MDRIWAILRGRAGSESVNTPYPKNLYPLRMTDAEVVALRQKLQLSGIGLDIYDRVGSQFMPDFAQAFLEEFGSKIGESRIQAFLAQQPLERTFLVAPQGYRSVLLELSPVLSDPRMSTMLESEGIYIYPRQISVISNVLRQYGVEAAVIEEFCHYFLDTREYRQRKWDYPHEAIEARRRFERSALSTRDHHVNPEEQVAIYMRMKIFDHMFHPYFSPFPREDHHAASEGARLVGRLGWERILAGQYS